MYFMLVFLSYTCLQLYAKIRSQDARIVDLARFIALNNVKLPESMEDSLPSVLRIADARKQLEHEWIAAAEAEAESETQPFAKARLNAECRLGSLSRRCRTPRAPPPLSTTGSLDGVAERLGKVRNYAVALIVAWFALAVSPAWLPTPDSALYLMLGRSIAQGHGYALDGHPHAYVPPGFPYMLAALERVGLGSMLCLNAAMALIGLASVWMSYLVGLANWLRVRSPCWWPVCWASIRSCT